jgi:DNA-directed RNA polymerase specialized sigma24 family protein
MDAAALQLRELAGQATYSAWLKLGQPSLSAMDWEDLKQEAWVAAWRASHASHAKANPAGYLFVVARSQVFTRYVRDVVARNPVSLWPLALADWVEVEETGKREPLPEQIRAGLEQIFRAARTQQQGRAVVAAQRDVRIVDLLWQGYRNAAIAQALGIPLDSVKKYRADIKRVLREEVKKGL